MSSLQYIAQASHEQLMQTGNRAYIEAQTALTQARAQASTFKYVSEVTSKNPHTDLK